MFDLRVLCALAAAFPALAQTLTLATGPVNEQVLQRDAEGRADIQLAGAAQRANGKFVEARVLFKDAAMAGFDWTSLGKVVQNKWAGEIKRIPTGGPYKVEVRLAGLPAASAMVQNLLVGDLWVLAGQSNMQGVGDLVDVQARQELIRSLDMTDKWAIAEEPLHRLADATDRVHWSFNENKEPEKLAGEKLLSYIAERKKGAGLGLPFATEMLFRTGVPVGLIPCAHGGTSMDQWDPGLKDKGSDSLYGATLRRIRLAGGKVRGILWYQGESDANPKAEPQFQKKFERLVAAFREDIGDSKLPFYYVQIGRYIDPKNANPGEWNSVQEQQRKAEASIGNTGMVAAVDLTLDDGIHVSTPDLKRLGTRLANLACHDLYPTFKGCGQYRRGPRVTSVKLAGSSIRVTFGEVNGKLVTEGRIAGFTVLDKTGAATPAIYRAQFDPTDANSILLYFGGKLPEGATLRYGYGKDPYCNLRDESDMGAPAFGPVAIQ